MSGGVSLAHIVHGVCNPRQRGFLSVVVGPDNSRPNGVTTTRARPPRSHSRHSPHLHSLISSHPFLPSGAQDRCGTTYLPTRSHTSTPHCSWASLPSFLRAVDPRQGVCPPSRVPHSARPPLVPGQVARPHFPSAPPTSHHPNLSPLLIPTPTSRPQQPPQPPPSHTS